MIKLTEEQRAAIKADAEQNAVGAGVGDTLRLLADFDALADELAAIRSAGGEQVEVVAIAEGEGELPERCWRGLKWADRIDPIGVPACSYLMTVAQHQRIVAAMAAELERLNRESQNLSDQLGSCDRKRRDAMAELEAARKQSPIGHVALGSHTGVVFYSHMPQLPDGTKLYAIPPLAGKVSVPRELLERLLNALDKGFPCIQVAEELRALLATPSMEVRHD